MLNHDDNQDSVTREIDIKIMRIGQKLKKLSLNKKLIMYVS
jgi:hypothetical protein